MSTARTGGRTKKAPARAAKKATPSKKASPAKKAKPLASGPNLEDPAFLKVRELCLALPDTVLTMTWGSPHFRVANKIFCGFGNEDGKHVMGVKLQLAHAHSAVKEARFWPAAYVGKHGWVSMDVTKRKSWNEVAALIRESYELIAPRASLAKLR